MSVVGREARRPWLLATGGIAVLLAVPASWAALPVRAQPIAVGDLCDLVLGSAHPAYGLPDCE